MLPDVSSIRNQDVDTDALLHAHMRVHADALGATISKCCKPRDRAETCPTCLMAASETFAHTAFACTHGRAADLARRHSTVLIDYMQTASPTWVSLYNDPSATDEKKACLVLHAANFLENDRIDNTHARLSCSQSCRHRRGLAWRAEAQTPALQATCPQR